MITEWYFYIVAIPAVILVGLSKGGLSGVGAISLPIMALAVSPVQAAAILLPILIVQDVVSVWAFRRTWDPHILKVMLPAATIGIFIGWLMAARVSGDGVLLMVGLISTLFGGHRLWLQYGGRPVAAPSRSPDWVGALCGLVSGFTSQLVHAGAPPYQIWVLPKRLPRDILVGTTAIFFAAVNWIKVPAYLTLGQFTRENLLTTAALMPMAIVSTFAGVWVVRRISGDRFYTLIYAMMMLVGLKLLWDAAA